MRRKSTTVRRDGPRIDERGCSALSTLLGVLLLALTSCAPPRAATQAMVSIEGDEAIRGMTSELHVVVRRLPDREPAVHDETFDPRLLTRDRPAVWDPGGPPVRMALNDASGVPGTRFEVEVEALDASRNVITSQRMIATFVPERTIEIDIVLNECCQRLERGAVAMPCGDGLTCRRLAENPNNCRCEDVELPPEGEPDLACIAEDPPDLEVGGAPRDMVELAMAGGNGAAVLDDGSLVSWGVGRAPVLSDTGVRHVFGGREICHLRAADSVLVCSGTEVSSLAGMRVLDACTGAEGTPITCVLVEPDRVLCWGMDIQGELSDPMVFSSPAGMGAVVPPTAPIEADLLADTVDVECGWSRVCARSASGEVRCWGYRFTGHPTPPEVLSFPGPVEQLSLGDEVTYGRVGRSWYAFGPDYQVPYTAASGCVAATLDPAAMLAPGIDSAVSQGKFLACGRRGCDTVCWGTCIGVYNPFASSALPYRVTGPSHLVAMGTADACAEIASGGIECWGASYGTMPVRVASAP